MKFSNHTNRHRHDGWGQCSSCWPTMWCMCTCLHAHMQVTWAILRHELCTAFSGLNS